MFFAYRKPVPDRLLPRLLIMLSFSYRSGISVATTRSEMSQKWRRCQRTQKIIIRRQRSQRVKKRKYGRICRRIYRRYWHGHRKFCDQIIGYEKATGCQTLKQTFEFIGGFVIRRWSTWDQYGWVSSNMETFTGKKIQIRKNRSYLDPSRHIPYWKK